MPRNRYLATELSNISVLRMYTPAEILAFFFPYRGPQQAEAIDQAGWDENTIESLNRKREFITTLPNYRNVWQQGFGISTLDKENVRYSYFYDKVRWFAASISRDAVEDENVRREISWIIKMEPLLLRVKRAVPAYVKALILEDMKTDSVLQILAKLLFYIAFGDADRWPHPNECVESTGDRPRAITSGDLPLAPNIRMDFRRSMDGSSERLLERWKSADHLRFLFLGGTELLCGARASRNYDGTLYDGFYELMTGAGAEKPEVDIILSDPDGLMAENAVKYKIFPGEKLMQKQKMLEAGVERIREIQSEMARLGSGKRLLAHITDVSLPYALQIVSFQNSALDYVKVDLYSPCITNNRERPSFYVFRAKQADLFAHFMTVFSTIWEDELISRELEPSLNL